MAPIGDPADRALRGQLLVERANRWAKRSAGSPVIRKLMTVLLGDFELAIGARSALPVVPVLAFEFANSVSGRERGRDDGRAAARTAERRPVRTRRHDREGRSDRRAAGERDLVLDLRGISCFPASSTVTIISTRFSPATCRPGKTPTCFPGSKRTTAFGRAGRRKTRAPRCWSAAPSWPDPAARRCSTTPMCSRTAARSMTRSRPPPSSASGSRCRAEACRSASQKAGCRRTIAWRTKRHPQGFHPRHRTVSPTRAGLDAADRAGAMLAIFGDRRTDARVGEDGATLWRQAAHTSVRNPRRGALHPPAPGTAPGRLYGVARLGGTGRLDAHAVHVNDEEIRLFANKGAGVCHCPSSNMRLASGIAPVKKYRDAGVRTGLELTAPPATTDRTS